MKSPVLGRLTVLASLSVSLTLNNSLPRIGITNLQLFLLLSHSEQIPLDLVSYLLICLSNQGALPEVDVSSSRATPSTSGGN